MNIFVFSNDPVQAAKDSPDKLVVKMILETAQLLCSVYWLQGLEAPYKLTHKNHPCAIYCRESKGNFQWVLEHGFGLCDEYTARYGKVHKTKDVLIWCSDNLYKLKFKYEIMTDFALAMPDKYKTNDAVESYRAYFRGEKQHLYQWKLNRPEWV